ncbi:GAF domain-containing protein [Pseudonocardia kujensis]|uniref:GAF domain-containing sensor histidine kinase n=1 Tax=Pseudonocardia kujensis TaxID=1128675 RepID=UPI001E37C884|nr:GAF domain-containing protein [Pseudonocardia kujensis]MCE0761901.1 GAF domain-containing protein [Pseudonocardia kujensis]
MGRLIGTHRVEVDHASALRFTKIAAGMLRARAVTLTDPSSIVASWGAPTVVGPALGPDPSPLRVPVPLQRVGSDATVTTVAGGVLETPYSLTVEWPASTVVEPRVQVMTRALARSAAAAVSADDGADAEERLVVSGGGILAELALTAESVEELLGGVTAVLCLLVGATAAGVAVLTDRNFLQVLPGSFGASRELIGSALVDRTEVATSTAEVFRSGRTMLANHPEVDIPRFSEWVDGFGVERLMTLPMIVGGDRLGVCYVANPPGDFTPVHARLAERLTPFVAAAVAQVRQRLEMQQREHLVLATERAAQAIAAGTNTAGLAPHLDGFRAALSCQAAVLTFRDDGHGVVCGDARRFEPETGFLAGIDAETAGLRTAMRRPERPGAFGWVSTQVPVIVDGEVRATLALLRTPWVPFRRHERSAIRKMADTVALAWTTDRYLREQAAAARMTERSRIADDIHDRVAQLLFAGRLSLQNLHEVVPGDLPADHGVRRHARRALELIDRGDRELREVIHHLAETAVPVRSQVEELCEVVAEVEQQFGITIRLDLPDGDAVPTLRGARRAAVLGAAREAMVNAAKHAGPCTISVVFAARPSGVAVLRVVDDGVGMRGSRPGYGLTAIRRRLMEQGASLVLRAGPDGGTEVLIEASAN